MRIFSTISIFCFFLLASIEGQVPAGYYDAADGLTGAALKNALHEIIDDHVVVSTSATFDSLRKLYEDPSDPSLIMLQWSGVSVDKNSTIWNREHIWPRSRGNNDKSGPDDTDLHGLMPVYASVNSTHSNLPYDISDINDSDYRIPASQLAPLTSMDSDSWQSPPSVKGDVARSLFYQEVRYIGDEPDTMNFTLVSVPPTGAQMSYLDVLLQWHLDDPVDDAERERCDVIYELYQGNRNPFIDHPEWVEEIWGSPPGSGTPATPVCRATTLSDTATESNGFNGVFLLELNQFSPVGGLLVQFTMSGDAVSADFVLSGDNVTYDAGTQTGTVFIPEAEHRVKLVLSPVDDAIFESDETAILTIIDTANYEIEIGTTDTATIMITDTPRLPVEWHFNAGVPADSIFYSDTGAGILDATSWAGDLTVFSGVTGQALALKGDIGNGSHIDFNFSFSGYTDMMVSFYTRGTSTGFDTGTWSFSLDGGAFTTLAGVNTASQSTSFSLQVVDFSEFWEIENTDDVILRYTLSGATTATGNNRIDEFTISGTALTNGTPGISLTVESRSVQEASGSSLDLVIRSTGLAPPGGIEVLFSLAGTAILPGLTGADYTFSNTLTFDSVSGVGSILIPEGTTRAVVSMTPINDGLDEGIESVVFQVEESSGHYIVSTTLFSATLFIAEPIGNDDFVDAYVLTGTSAETAGSNFGAGVETGEPTHGASASGKSVWWQWTAPEDGAYTISTEGSDYDTSFGVYTGTAVNALTQIDDGSLTSVVTLNATGGTTYFIAVDGKSWGTSEGNIILKVDKLATPDNDLFVNAIALVGNSVTTTGTNVLATEENNETNARGASVWWKWTATADGALCVNTDGSDFDTYLNIFTGSSVDALTRIAYDDDSGEGLRSYTCLNVTNGTTYYIAVDGYWSGSQGDINLGLEFGSEITPSISGSIFNDEFTESNLNPEGDFYLFFSPTPTSPIVIYYRLTGTAVQGVDYNTHFGGTLVSGDIYSIAISAYTPWVRILFRRIVDTDLLEFDETIQIQLIEDPAYSIPSDSEGIYTLTLKDDTPYTEVWADAYAPSLNSSNADPLGDIDGDGVINLLEFAFDVNPVEGLSFPGIDITVQDLADPNDGNIVKEFPVISFTQRTDASNLVYTIEGSLDLATWNTQTTLINTIANADGVTEEAIYRSDLPLSGTNAESRQFFRVKVEEN